MKEKLLSWGTLMCLAVLTCLLLLHALAIFPGVAAVRWFFVTCAVVLGRLDAPAWVQAVGSVLAILAAVGIAMWQRHSERQHARERARAAAAIAGVTVQAMMGPLFGALMGVHSSIERSEPDDGREEIEGTVALLKGFELPTDAQLIALHEVCPAIAKNLAIGCSVFRQTVQYLEVILLTSEEVADQDWYSARFKETKGRFKRTLELFQPAYRDLNALIASKTI